MGGPDVIAFDFSYYIFLSSIIKAHECFNVVLLFVFVFDLHRIERQNEKKYGFITISPSKTAQSLCGGSNNAFETHY